MKLSRIISAVVTAFCLAGSAMTASADIADAGTEETVAKRNCIIILAQFKNLEMTYSRENFIRLINTGNHSVKKYFTDQFQGKCEFNFDIGPLVTLGKPFEYYGRNVNGADANAAEAVAEACRLAARQGVDFSKYDDDGDGTVDNVFVFTAGKDEADGGGDNALWSNSWSLEKAGISLTLNGKKINRYAMCSELGRGKDGKFHFAGIGMFCHEFGHVLGLVDLYNTEVRATEIRKGYLWGTTSLMDNGCRNNEGRTPPNLNAIERDMLGIGNPETLAEGHYILEPIHENGRYLRFDTANEGEYFLVECRSQAGWDMYIGGKGLAIYHIDKSSAKTGHSKKYERVATAAERWMSNEVNCNPDHECADMMEALAEAVDASQVFYPYGKNNEFSAESVPAFRLWDGTAAPLAIKDIMIAGNNVEFNVVRNPGTTVPEALELRSQVFQDVAILQWKAETNGASIPAKVVWGPADAEGIEENVYPYDAGEYALRIEGLKPSTTYTVKIQYETESGTGKEITVKVVTKRVYNDGYPFIYLKDIERNTDHSFKAGTMIPLIVYNLSNARGVEWLMDGKEIVPGKDGYFRVDRSCVISAHVTYIDGSTDIIEKKMVVR